MEQISIEFPLKGEWTVINTPAYRIPSHGTDFFAQRYAFDFVKLNWRNLDSRTLYINIPTAAFSRYFSKKRSFYYLFHQANVSDFYSWLEPVFAPFDGFVIGLGDGWNDREEWNLIIDFTINICTNLPGKLGYYFIKSQQKIRKTNLFNDKDLRPLCGNYVKIQSGSTFAFYAHLNCGSINLSAHQKVLCGQELGRIGNSGNTAFPHLHFQLMDNPNPLRAKGLPCCFRQYERYDGKRWQLIRNGVPDRFERIRSLF